MEKALEKARKAVLDYSSKPSEGELDAVRALLAAVISGRKYVRANAQSDPGCGERLARSLDDLLDQLPGSRKLADNKKSLPHLYKARMAAAHLERIQAHLSCMLQTLEDKLARRIQNWAEANPVLHDLARVTAEPLPKDAYVLIFQQTEGQDTGLVTRSARDGRVFTRFHPQDLSDNMKLYKLFAGQPPVTGAALMTGAELLLVIGNVPGPGDPGERHRHLLSLSSEAVGKPVRDFLAERTALRELHLVCSKRNPPKHSYVLLFQDRSGDDPGTEPELVVRSSGEGRVITRFRPGEFADKRKLFDTFRDGPAVVGAAVIKEDELLHAFGRLPAPAEGQTQMQALLKTTRKALEQPAFDFLSANAVLKNLHDLANGGSLKREAEVILFTDAGGGRVTVLKPAHEGRPPRSKTPLYEFKSARTVQERFASQPQIVGGSVIGATQTPARKPIGPAGTRQRGDQPIAAHRRSRSPEARPVVLASFGKTPLKAGILATDEILRRLGIEL
jgi:hypothetical protein